MGAHRQSRGDQELSQDIDNSYQNPYFRDLYEDFVTKKICLKFEA